MRVIPALVACISIAVVVATDSSSQGWSESDRALTRRFFTGSSSSSNISGGTPSRQGSGHSGGHGGPSSEHTTIQHSSQRTASQQSSQQSARDLEAIGLAHRMVIATAAVADWTSLMTALRLLIDPGERSLTAAETLRARFTRRHNLEHVLASREGQRLQARIGARVLEQLREERLSRHPRSQRELEAIMFEEVHHAAQQLQREVREEDARQQRPGQGMLGESTYFAFGHQAEQAHQRRLEQEREQAAKAAAEGMHGLPVERLAQAARTEGLWVEEQQQQQQQEPVRRTRGRRKRPLGEDPRQEVTEPATQRQRLVNPFLFAEVAERRFLGLGPSKNIY